eukprot:762029-Hanusia_phi.AAC.2
MAVYVQWLRRGVTGSSRRSRISRAVLDLLLLPKRNRSKSDVLFPVATRSSISSAILCAIALFLWYTMVGFCFSASKTEIKPSQTRSKSWWFQDGASNGMQVGSLRAKRSGASGKKSI